MNFDTLLTQLESSRPDLSESISLLRQYQNSRKDDSYDETDKTGAKSWRDKELGNLLERQKQINHRLLENYRQLEENFRELVAQLDEIAQAIGACPQCWGEDLNCIYCKGRGVPGYFPLNQACFDKYLRPVINKLKSEINTQ